MWDYILDFYEGKIECDDYYDVRKCHEDPEETNYRTWCRLNQTRRAIHVGGLDFMGLQGKTYDALIPDIMQSKQEDIAGLLEDYPVLLYDGNFDFTGNHTGILNMFEMMTNWSGIPRSLRGR